VYDVSKSAELQLPTPEDVPTLAYYFGTPTIFCAQPALFARTRLEAILDTYVDAFLRRRRHCGRAVAACRCSMHHRCSWRSGLAA
jgi:hypothetical protein